MLKQSALKVQNALSLCCHFGHLPKLQVLEMASNGICDLWAMSRLTNIHRIRVLNL